MLQKISRHQNQEGLICKPVHTLPLMGRDAIGIDTSHFAPDLSCCRASSFEYSTNIYYVASEVNTPGLLIAVKVE